MGTKAILELGDTFRPIVEINTALVSFINKHGAKAIAIKQAFGKPLDTVTDQDILDHGGHGIPIPQIVMDEIKQELAVLQRIIDAVKPLRDILPANDYQG